MQKWRKPATVSMSWDVIIAKSSKSAHSFAPITTGARDVLLGMIELCPFYVGGTEFDYWAYFQLTIGVTHGGGDSFSIEAADGVRFVTRSRMFTDTEAAL